MINKVVIIFNYVDRVLVSDSNLAVFFEWHYLLFDSSKLNVFCLPEQIYVVYNFQQTDSPEIVLSWSIQSITDVKSKKETLKLVQNIFSAFIYQENTQYVIEVYCQYK